MLIIAHVGSITAAVHAAKSVAGFALRVHVECQSLAEAREAIAAGADIIMLDNFTPEQILVAAKELREDRGVGGGKNCLVEVSGGLTEENMADHLCPGQSLHSSSLSRPLTRSRNRCGYFIDFVDSSRSVRRRFQSQNSAEVESRGDSFVDHDRN